MPGIDRRHLEYGGGLYGQATRFAVLSRKLCFGRGEGLPGKAWEQGRPLLLKLSRARTSSAPPRRMPKA